MSSSFELSFHSWHCLNSLCKLCASSGLGIWILVSRSLIICSAFTIVTIFHYRSGRAPALYRRAAARVHRSSPSILRARNGEPPPSEPSQLYEGLFRYPSQWRTQARQPARASVTVRLSSALVTRTPLGPASFKLSRPPVPRARAGSHPLGPDSRLGQTGASAACIRVW